MVVYMPLVEVRRNKDFKIRENVLGKLHGYFVRRFGVGLARVKRLDKVVGTDAALFAPCCFSSCHILICHLRAGKAVVAGNVPYFAAFHRNYAFPVSGLLPYWQFCDFALVRYIFEQLLQIARPRQYLRYGHFPASLYRLPAFYAAYHFCKLADGGVRLRRVEPPAYIAQLSYLIYVVAREVQLFIQLRIGFCRARLHLLAEHGCADKLRCVQAAARHFAAQLRKLLVVKVYVQLVLPRPRPGAFLVFALLHYLPP
jgi:hypothetical protein